MFTQLCLQASKAANKRIQGPDVDFRDINIPRSNVTQEGVICNLCNTLTKRFTYHVKKFHKDSLINGSKVFASQFKKFLNTVRQQKHKGLKDPKVLREHERQMNTRFSRPNRDMGREFPPGGEFPPPSSIQYFGGGDFLA